MSDSLTMYDLKGLACSLWPMMTPLRNRIHRVEEDLKEDSCVTLGEEDFINGHDILPITTTQMRTRLLQKLMFKEEMAILTGNRSFQLSKPDRPVLSIKSNPGIHPKSGHIPVNVAVVALTAEGWKNSSLHSQGIAARKIITGSDGETYTLFGGSSDKSPIATISYSPDDTLAAWVPLVYGAVAYGWFAGLEGHESLQQITTINSVVFNQPILTGNQPLSQITEDCSSNPQLAYDGLLTHAFLSGASYIDALPTGDPGRGTPLTSSSRSTVTEIDLLLEGMVGRGLTTDIIFTNSQEMKQICTILGSGTIERYPLPLGGEDKGEGPLLSIHPHLPPGTIIGWSQKCKARKPEEGIPWDSSMVFTRKDYYAINWPQRNIRSREYGVYVEEWLNVYEPSAIAVITNIGTKDG